MSEKSLTDRDPGLSDKRKAELIATLSSIREKLDRASENSPTGVKPRLLLATKTRTPEEINFALSLGYRLIGENRVQELIAKYDELNKDGLELHFIGALQTNKVKYVVDKVDMIESVDRLSLASEIDKQAAKIQKVMDVLVEVNIGAEATKSGVAPRELIPFLEKMRNFAHIRVCGLMAIPPKCQSPAKQKETFEKMLKLYIDISKKKMDNVSMTVLSIGMSSDYELAAACGSTEVRVGTAAFGPRNC